MGLDVDLSTEVGFCETCVEGKQTRESIARMHRDPRSSSIGDFIHSDIWGPAKYAGRGNLHFFSTWIDDHSKYCITHLQHRKNQTLEKYKLVEATYKTQFNVLTIKNLHTDRGGEYMGDDFKNHLSKRGTAHTMPAHDSSAQNGVTERKN